MIPLGKHRSFLISCIFLCVLQLGKKILLVGRSDISQWDIWDLGASLGYFFFLFCEAEDCLSLLKRRKKCTLFQFIGVFISTSLRGVQE